MKLSYEGIGQWAATFACDDLAEGELVKVSANGTVAACAAGDDFCGMVLSVGRGGDACAVALAAWSPPGTPYRQKERHRPWAGAASAPTARAASRRTRTAAPIWWWMWTPPPRP